MREKEYEAMVDRLINIILRTICGGILIFFINMLLNRWGITLGIGVNAVTLLISGILGLPGIGVLYCLGIYKML